MIPLRFSRLNLKNNKYKFWVKVYLYEAFYMAFLESKTDFNRWIWRLATFKLNFFVTAVKSWKSFRCCSGFGRIAKFISQVWLQSIDTEEERDELAHLVSMIYLDESDSDFINVCKFLMEDGSAPIIRVLKLFK